MHCGGLVKTSCPTGKSHIELDLVILPATPLNDSKQEFYLLIFHVNIVEHYHCDEAGTDPLPNTDD